MSTSCDALLVSIIFYFGATGLGLDAANCSLNCPGLFVCQSYNSTLEQFIDESRPCFLNYSISSGEFSLSLRKEIYNVSESTINYTVLVYFIQETAQQNPSGCKPCGSATLNSTTNTFNLTIDQCDTRSAGFSSVFIYYDYDVFLISIFLVDLDHGVYGKPLNISP